jgi:tyrosyl-tRNA synthetase
MTQAFYEKTVIDKNNYHLFKQLFTDKYIEKIAEIDKRLKENRSKNKIKKISAKELLS